MFLAFRFMPRGKLLCILVLFAVSGITFILLVTIKCLQVTSGCKHFMLPRIMGVFTWFLFSTLFAWLVNVGGISSKCVGSTTHSAS